MRTEPEEEFWNQRWSTLQAGKIATAIAGNKVYI
jgi:hypothetical protein